jgi:hypothetical protein
MAKKITYQEKLELSPYSMFRPQSLRGLMQDYPELKKEDAFKTLSKFELYLCWYFACEASPLSDLKSDKTRISRAISLVQESNPDIAHLDRDTKLRFEDLDFPEKFARAVERMSKYKMGPRIRAKKMVDNILSKYEKLVEMDIESDEFIDKEGGRDMTKIKQFIDASATIIKQMPTIISMAENGFSITEGGESADEEDLGVDGGVSLIDQFHELND